jgi:hypothetical protein
MRSQPWEGIPVKVFSPPVSQLWAHPYSPFWSCFWLRPGEKFIRPWEWHEHLKLPCTLNDRATPTGICLLWGRLQELRNLFYWLPWQFFAVSAEILHNTHNLGESLQLRISLSPRLKHGIAVPWLWNSRERNIHSEILCYTLILLGLRSETNSNHLSRCNMNGVDGVGKFSHH